VKTLIISAFAAVISHAVLFVLNPQWEKPRLVPPRTRSVTVTLATLAPKVQPPPPLPVVGPAPISPLQPLVLKKPPSKPKPVSEPKPIAKPEPQPAAAEPEVVPQVPPPDPPPVSVAAEDKPAETGAVIGKSSAPVDVDSLSAALDSRPDEEAAMVVTDPSPVFNPKPVYPKLARRRQYQGKVIVRAHVDIHGRVARVDLVQSSGYPVLDRSAKEGVLQWRFVPATRKGVPVEAVVEFPVIFRIE